MQLKNTSVVCYLCISKNLDLLVWLFKFRAVAAAHSLIAAMSILS